MCGVCVEPAAIRIVAEEAQGPIHEKMNFNEIFQLDVIFYLRETTNFMETFDWLRQGIGNEKITSVNRLPAEIIILRALEMRIEQGFNDPAYQKLLSQPLFRSLIRKVCGKKWQNDFTETTKGLELDPLSILYNADTFLKDNKLLESMKIVDVLPACRRLLKHYHSWWLKGETLGKNNCDDRTKVSDLNSVDRFDLLLRAIYFSVITIGNIKASKHILWELAHNRQAGGSTFEANDLWLQRVASLKLYDMVGFDKFIKYFPDFRVTLFYYIGLRRGYTQTQKKLLLEAAQQYPVNERDPRMTIENCDWE